MNFFVLSSEHVIKKEKRSYHQELLQQPPLGFSDSSVSSSDLIRNEFGPGDDSNPESDMIGVVRLGPGLTGLIGCRSSIDLLFFF